MCSSEVMDDRSHLISEETLVELGAYHLDAARAAQADRQLGDAALLERNALLAGVDPKSYVDGLLNDRAKLVERLGGHRIMKDPGGFLTESSWMDGVLDAILKQLAEGWWLLKVPTIGEGPCEHPPQTDTTSGMIDTVWRGPGSVAYGGNLEQYSGRGAQDEEYWVCRWHYTVVFPPAPHDGLLSYRFGINARLTPYQPTAISGGLYAWINIGTTNNSALPIGNWKAVMPWPVAESLPLAPGTFPSFGRDVPVSGNVLVKEGQKAALGVVFGVVIGLAGGSTSLLSANTSFMTHKAEPYSLPADIGKIEYRFAPSWLAEVVKDTIDLDLERLFP